ncbi:MAG: hypothetical protein HONDAALG_01071 [Gammaproteobacteria bacterium]|nr:hypothetical protein [Gammaproteobacteria bacterium]
MSPLTRNMLSLSVATWAVLAAPAGGAATFPAQFSANYTVSLNGQEMGVMARTVSRQGPQDYLFRSELKATHGLYALLRVKVVESSRWRLAGEQVRAIEYRSAQTGPKRRESTARFDWENMLVHVTHKRQNAELKATPGMLDKLLYQLVLMRDLQSGRSPIRYTVVDGNKVRNYPVEIMGEEDIETPLGMLKTVKVRYRKPGSERSTTLWCAKSLGFLPVKLDHYEKEGERTSALIRSVSGL